jgi:TolA-binding protein
MVQKQKKILTAVMVIFVGVLFFSDICFSLTVKDSMKLYDRGQREYKRGDYNDAIDYFKKAINECPESAMTEVSMYFLGKSYQMAGNKNMADTTFTRLIDKYKSGKWVKWAKKEIKNR